MERNGSNAYESGYLFFGKLKYGRWSAIRPFTTRGMSGMCLGGINRNGLLVLMMSTMARNISGEEVSCQRSLKRLNTSHESLAEGSLVLHPHDKT